METLDIIIHFDLSTSASSGLCGFQLLLFQQHYHWRKTRLRQIKAPRLLSWNCWNVNLLDDWWALLPDINNLCRLNSFFKRTGGSTADVNICSSSFFFPFPPYKLFMNSARVKGHEVINRGSQLAAVSKVSLFLCANEEPWGGVNAFLRTELCDMCLQAFVIVWLLLALQTRRKQSTQDSSQQLHADQLTY